MFSQSLNGIWEYRVGKGIWGKKQVPYSRLAVGHSEIRRSFDLLKNSKSVFLRFEGITYLAKVYLNDMLLGEMLPYSEYLYDISSIVKKKNNILLVELEDIDSEFGPSEGWENFGGIIRNVNLLYGSDARLTDVFFKCTLENNYQDAKFLVDISADAREGDQCEITLTRNGKKVFSDTRAFDVQEKEYSLSQVDLWSTDTPNLYGLKVRLFRGRVTLDTYETQVGFREFTCERHRFLLNGNPVFLHGVCKHEMIGDSGHCPSVEQIEQDMRMIKETGSNFVRLVHYPHRKETIEIADRIGLMVSEEPGLWWSDTSNPVVSKGSIEVLRRVIMRDRNHPSVVFWLCFNECVFTEQFLIDSAKMCKKTDPTRLVSGANCMSNEDTLKYYNICGFDFYTMHPYAQSFSQRPAVAAKVLYDKPLMFTEWGGHYLYDNPKLLGEFIREMIRLYRKNSDEGALAGATFWFWAELNDFNREKPACYDGVLKEGLMTSDRKPTMIYQTFCDTWRELYHPVPKTSYYEPLEPEVAGIPLFGPAEKHSQKEIVEATKIPGPPHLCNRHARKQIPNGPVLPESPLENVERIPWMLASGESAVFSRKNVTGSRIRILGAVSLGKGYPILGAYGEQAGTVTVSFSNGSEKQFPLRNGIELTTAATTLGSSRIEPIAESAVPHAHFGYDRNFENYLLNSLTLTLPGRRNIQSVTVSCEKEGYYLLVYGILVE